MPDGLDPTVVRAPRERKPRRRGRRWAYGFAALAVWSVGMMAVGGYLGYQRVNERVPEPQAITQVTVVVEEVALPDVVEEQLLAPDVAGLTEDEARAVVANLRSTTQIKVTTAPAAGETGRVVGQVPAPGDVLADTFELTLSAPAETPNLVGQPGTAARTALEDLGARVVVTRSYRSGAAVGTVLSTEPAAGAPLGAEVSIVVAAAPEAISLADVPPVEERCAVGDGTANGASYTNSWRCSTTMNDIALAVNLLRKVDHFAATLAIDDQSPRDASARVEILLDGVVVFDNTVAFGTSLPIELSTAGALRMEVRITSTASSSGDIVLANGLLTGSAADIDAVSQQ